MERLKERSGQRWRWQKSLGYRINARKWKHNSKKAYQLVKDLTADKQGKSTTIQDKSWKCLTEEHEITMPKKGILQLCQNYKTISLISHPSKVMLKIIINRLHPQAEEIIAEKKAGFRAGRSTTEQIFNLRILCEKYLQHQQNLYHVFIDFQKAFVRVWHEALCATMRKYNINANIKLGIENLYDKAQSAVLFNGSTGDWLVTTVGSPARVSSLTNPLQHLSRDNHGWGIGWPWR